MSMAAAGRAAVAPRGASTASAARLTSTSPPNASVRSSRRSARLSSTHAAAIWFERRAPSSESNMVIEQMVPLPQSTTW
jgi:hypothetical protein